MSHVGEKPTSVDYDTKQHVIESLQTAYMSEIETVANYIANSVTLDGVAAQEVKRALHDDIGEELGHAQKLAQRIKELGGQIPGSKALMFRQDKLQPPESSTDLMGVIEGVIAAEQDAVDQYRHIAHETDGVDYVTQDLVIDILADEEQHLVLFEGFRKELEQHGGHP